MVYAAFNKYVGFVSNKQENYVEHAKFTLGILVRITKT